MLKEVKNNVYNALFVAADEEGQRYAAFESDWNGEYWEAKNKKAEAKAPAFFVWCDFIKKINDISIRASFTPLELDRQAQYLKGAYAYRQGYYSITPTNSKRFLNAWKRQRRASAFNLLSSVPPWPSGSCWRLCQSVIVLLESPA